MKTYAEIITERYAPLSPRHLSPGECQTPLNKKCSLCFAGKIPYDTELKQKAEAIGQFWDALGKPITAGPLTASPAGRSYRMVSKRKAFIVNKRFFFGLIGVDDDSLKSYPMDIERCAIEPASHASVYGVIRNVLQRKQQSNLVKEFNYVIVKGDDRECIVIFNMNHFSSANRNEVNALSKLITKHVPAVQGIFVFVDEERSEYYLSGTPRKGMRSNPKPLTKIFGRDKLFHKVNDLKFLYSPLSFTQTNHSILEEFVGTVKQMLAVTKNDLVADLYCGYGLFSLCLAGSAENVIAVEVSRTAINDGIDNARRNAVTNTKFVCADISGDSLEKILKRSPSKVLLDPPRNGTAPGVIEFLAEKKPQRVVHIFCNTEIIGSELQRWEQCGYHPVAAQPVDMFPGTREIEFVVALEPAGQRAIPS